MKIVVSGQARESTREAPNSKPVIIASFLSQQATILTQAHVVRSIKGLPAKDVVCRLRATLSKQGFAQLMY